MRDIHDRLSGQMKNRVRFIFIQCAFETRKILNVSLHERSLPVIAGAKKTGLRIRIAHERNHARA